MQKPHWPEGWPKLSWLWRKPPEPVEVPSEPLGAYSPDPAAPHPPNYQPTYQTLPAESGPNLAPLIWLGVIAFVVTTWLIAASYTNVWTVLLALLASLGTPLIALRIKRGSVKNAKDEADEVQRIRHVVPEKDLPKRVRRLLLRQEEVLLHYHEHHIGMWKWWFGGLILQPICVFGGIKSGSGLALLVLWFLGMAAIGIQLLRWVRSQTFVTNRRLMRVSGVFGTRQAVMPVAKVTDAQMDISAWAELLARLRIVHLPWATIHVESAGQTQALEFLYYVENPVEVLNTILEEAVPAARAAEAAGASDE